MERRERETRLVTSRDADSARKRERESAEEGGTKIKRKGNGLVEVRER